MSKSVLMICYYYPPLTDVGCKRSVAFSKYFGRHGWNPYILTVKNADKTYCSVGSDKAPSGIAVEYSYSVINPYKWLGKANGLLSRILKIFGVEVKRNYLYDILCIPDFFWGWIPLTIFKGYKLVRDLDIDIIYVSCTPYSSAVIGVFLRALTNKSLVVDFRDQFGLQIGWLDKMSSVPKFRKKLDRWFMHQVLKRTDLFIVTSDETKKLYMEQYPEIRGKMFTVHNGFETEFLEIVERRPKFSKFTIVYAGEFYFYALNSKIFFEAIAVLKKRGMISKSNFEFRFFGDNQDRIRQIAKEYGIDDVVVAKSRISYKEVLNVISRSHLQLLRIVRPMISTKLFEGIALNIPFLATIPSGEVEDLIAEYSPDSYIITNESSDEIAAAIVDSMERYRKDGIGKNRVAEFLTRYSREALSMRLTSIIEENLR